MSTYESIPRFLIKTVEKPTAIETQMIKFDRVSSNLSNVLKWWNQVKMTVVSQTNRIVKLKNEYGCSFRRRLCTDSWMKLRELFHCYSDKVSVANFESRDAFTEDLLPKDYAPSGHVSSHISERPYPSTRGLSSFTLVNSCRSCLSTDSLPKYSAFGVN